MSRSFKSFFGSTVLILGLASCSGSGGSGGSGNEPADTTTTSHTAGGASGSIPDRAPSEYKLTSPLSCLNRISGSWNFGNVPAACNVRTQQSPDEVQREYAQGAIFPDAQNNDNSRSQYMTTMYAAVRDLGEYYMRRRNPGADGAEVSGFLRGLYALLTQETLWTHYRRGVDGIIRYMRGDQLYGYGIMQVDQRSHSAALKRGVGGDLIDNMLYGLDIFYSNWVKSATVSCVSSRTDYVARARAAWSAYNGGAGSICRWANSGSKYASFDRSYFSRYQSQPWLAFVQNMQAPASINVRCLAEGVRPCRS